MLAASVSLSLLGFAQGRYTTFGGPRMEWAVSPVQYQVPSTYLPYTVNHVSEVPAAGFPPEVSSLAPNTQYALRVRMQDVASGEPLYRAAAEFSYVGGYPDVRISKDSKLDISAIYQTWKTGVPMGVREWYVPFNTSAAGALYVHITTNGCITRTIVDNGLQDAVELLSVSWIVPAVGKTLFGTYQEASAVPPPPADAKLFFPRFAPGLSTGWFGFYDVLQQNVSASSQESVVLYTESKWKSGGSSAITIDNLSSKGLTNRCQLGSLPGHLVLNGAVIDNCLTLHTLGGIVLECLNKTDPSSVKFSNPLPYCISNLALPSQLPSFTRPACSAVFALGGTTETGNTAASGRIWMKTLVTDDFVELLDSASRPLFTAMNDSNAAGSLIVISAAISPVSCTSVQLLVKNTQSNRYSVAQYSLSKYSWSETFVFPKYVPNISADSTSRAVPVYSGTEIASQGAEVRELQLSGMHFHRTLGRDMFIYGSALFFSPNDGRSVYLIRTFPGNTSITTLTSADDGDYAFMTTDGQVYYGQLGISRTVPVTDHLDTSVIRGLMFDELGELNLFTVAVHKSTGSAYVESKIVDVQSMLDYAEYADQTKCPYSHIKYLAPNLVHFTRSLKTATNDLPSDLFLDVEEEYDFAVILTPSDWLEDLAALNVYFSLTNEGVVKVEYNRTELNGQVRYDVSLRDRGVVTAQAASGQEATPTQLRLIAANSSFDCLNFKRATSVKSETINLMNIYSGCPPKISMEFVPDAKMFTGCILPDPDVPCIYYETTFQPKFAINDIVAGNSTPYLGKYQMLVVGGGPSRDEVALFSEDEITRYNPSIFGSGLTPIWGAAGDGVTYSQDEGAPVMSLDKNDVTWVCSSGSPCHRVYPYRHSQPEYFLLLEVTTGNVSIDSTYCDLNVRFLVRLYGLPLDVNMSIIITFTTTGVSMVLLISHGYYRRWRDPTLRPSPPPEMEKFVAPSTDKLGEERRMKSKVAPLEHTLSGVSGVIRTAALTEGEPGEPEPPFVETRRGSDADAASVNRRPSSVSFAEEEGIHKPISRF